MALMPKRVKHRKSQRGRIKGEATRGNRVVFGDFGLQATQGGWLSAQAIEAGRVAASQYMRNEGRLYVRVFPHKSVTLDSVGNPHGQRQRRTRVLGRGGQARDGAVRDRRHERRGGANVLRAVGPQDAGPRAVPQAARGVSVDDSRRLRPQKHRLRHMKTSELREMSDEQLRLTWKEASENLFRLRLQAQTERLDAPSELRRHRRLIARCQDRASTSASWRSPRTK